MWYHWLIVYALYAVCGVGRFHAALFYLEDEDWPQVQHAYEQHIWRIDSQPTASRSASISSSPSGHVHVSPAIDERPLILPPHDDHKSDGGGEAALFQPFLSSDKGKIEDQLNALLVLWKWQVRNSAAQPTPATDFTAYYCQLLSHVRWPPSQALGLYGLVLLQACVSGRDEGKTSELRRSMQQRVDAMDHKDGAQSDRKRTKHVALYLPIADAIIAYYGGGGEASAGASGVGRQKAYQLLAPIMSTYHRWLHRQERKHSATSAPSPPAASSGGGSRVSWQSAAFPWSGRHLLQVVVGSGEQRSALSDWWLQLLYDTQHYVECEHEAEQWLAYRRTESTHFYRRMRDESQSAASSERW